MVYPVALNRIHTERKRFCEPCGERIVDKMSLDFKKGYAKLKKVGEHDLYAEIQSHKAECDLSVLLKGIDIAPDALTFNEVEERVLDLTAMPRNYAEFFDTARDAENLFAELPSDVRKEYGNSVYTFINDVTSDGLYCSLKKAYGVKDKQDIPSALDPVPDVPSPADPVVLQPDPTKVNQVSTNTDTTATA